MDANQIKERIEKKEAQIYKIEKKIAKHEARKSEEVFCQDRASYFVFDPKECKKIKTFDQLAEIRKKFDPEGDAKQWVENAYADHLKNEENEVRWATKELEEAKAQLAKYKAQLGDKEEKASIVKIPVIVEFLDAWAENVADYIRDNVKNVTEYYKANHERIDLDNNAWYMLRNGEITKEELNYKRREMKAHEEQIKARIHPLSMSVYDRRSESHVDEARLAEILEKDKEAKYWNLVKKVEKITGPITDAKHLGVGNKGDLTGYIIGENGKANVQTIGAGGINNGVIVNVKHGQIFHYRSIVTKIN